MMRETYGILMSMFRFSFRQIILILLIRILVSMMAVIVPVLKISHKKPIDVIGKR